MKSLKNDVKAWLLLCSGLGTILFLMGSTFYIVVSQSLGLYSMGGEESQFSLEYWQAVLNSPVFQNSYIYSVKVSLLGAILSIIVALSLIHIYFAMLLFSAYFWFNFGVRWVRCV